MNAWITQNKITPTQGQFDALVNIAYQWGAGVAPTFGEKFKNIGCCTGTQIPKPNVPGKFEKIFMPEDPRNPKPGGAQRIGPSIADSIISGNQADLDAAFERAAQVDVAWNPPTKKDPNKGAYTDRRNMEHKLASDTLSATDVPGANPVDPTVVRPCDCVPECPTGQLQKCCPSRIKVASSVCVDPTKDDDNNCGKPSLLCCALRLHAQGSGLCAKTDGHGKLVLSAASATASACKHLHKNHMTMNSPRIQARFAKIVE